MFFPNSNGLAANHRKSRFGIKQTYFTPCTFVGGGWLNAYVLTGGGQPNAYVCVREGGGGKKSPIFCVRTKWMPPYKVGYIKKTE